MTLLQVGFSGSESYTDLSACTVVPVMKLDALRILCQGLSGLTASLYAADAMLLHGHERWQIPAPCPAQPYKLTLPLLLWASDCSRKEDKSSDSSSISWHHSQIQQR